MAVAAVLIGGALSVAVLAVSVIGEDPSQLIGLPGVYLMGLLWFGWQLLPVTLAAAIAWVAAMRLLMPTGVSNSPGVMGRG